MMAEVGSATMGYSSESVGDFFTCRESCCIVV